MSETKHPWYGPCDAFDNGECFECHKVIEELRARLAVAKEALHDLCSCMTAACNCRACAALAEIEKGPTK